MKFHIPEQLSVLARRTIPREKQPIHNSGRLYIISMVILEIIIIILMIFILASSSSLTPILTIKGTSLLISKNGSTNPAVDYYIHPFHFCKEVNPHNSTSTSNETTQTSSQMNCSRSVTPLDFLDQLPNITISESRNDDDTQDYIAETCKSAGSTLVWTYITLLMIFILLICVTLFLEIGLWFVSVFGVLSMVFFLVAIGWAVTALIITMKINCDHRSIFTAKVGSGFIGLVFLESILCLLCVLPAWLRYRKLFREWNAKSEM